MRRGSNWPLFELFGDKMKGSKQVVDAYIMPIVDSAMNAKKGPAEGQNDDEESTSNLLEYLVSRTEGELLTSRVKPLITPRFRSRSGPRYLTGILARWTRHCM